MANNNPDAEADTAAQVNGAAATTTANTAATRRSPNDPARKPSTTSTSNTIPSQPQTKPALAPATTTSAGASPRTSRNASPERKDSRPPPLANTPSTQPSAAAIQRALSAASVPQLPSGGVSEAVSKLPKTSKSAAGSGDVTPRWPTSPRLKSPPPSTANSRRGSNTTQKRSETAAAPSISVQSATPQTSTPPPAKQGGDETGAKAQQQQLTTPVKGPSRGASGKSVLETVQENSVDDVKEPSPAAVKAAADLKPLTRLTDEDGKAGKAGSVNGDGETQSLHAESGSESAGAKERRKEKDTGSIATRPKNGTAKSYASLSSKSRQPDSKPNMTVETETVQSIPQSVLTTGDRSGSARNDNSGSVRLKPSNETIRPKKERKKATQKARSLNQGTASSKADIFEARVASAIDDEADNSSDSEETFVYESNPPEPPLQRRTRHHSRTPSVTSAHSVADGQRGVRAFGDVLDERRVGGKRSMKFSNNAYNNDVDSVEGNDGSVRSHTPRHFGRFGRGGSHASMFDPDSPFTQASKLRSQQLSARNSRPGSPRSPQSAQQQQQASTRASSLFGRKQEPSYDFDAEGGDDERQPLLGTVRTPRPGRLHRRISARSNGDNIDSYYGVRRNPRCGRFGGCLLGFIVCAAVVLSALAFLVMSNQPMYDVRIAEIQNVLASEQELMLDLLVGAVNPNALGIGVVDMDVNLFARSKYVGGGEKDDLAAIEGAGRKRRRRPADSLLPPADVRDNGQQWQDLTPHWHAPSPPLPPPQHSPTTTGGVDHGTDPPNFPDDDPQTLLLGHILHFDQGLEFSGSPLKRHTHFSLGELRLEKPGNTTEDSDGGKKWEVVVKHPFELLVRGVLIYGLPVSGRTERVRVSGAVGVKVEEDGEGSRRLVRLPMEERCDGTGIGLS